MIEKRSICKDGSIIWVRVRIAIIRESDNKPIYLFAIAEDVTAARQAEAALQQAQSLLEIASHVAHMGAWSVEVATMKVRLSEEAISIHEEAADFEPIAEQAILYYVPEYQKIIRKSVEDCIEKGISFDEELEFITAKGRRIWVRSIGQAVRDTDGNIVRIEGAIINIDHIKREEIEKLASLRRIQRIASRLPGVIYEFRLYPDGKCTMPYASDYIRQLFHIDPADVVSDASPAFKYLHPDDIEKFHASIADSAATLRPWQHEWRMRFEDGLITWLRGNSLPQKEANGSVLWHGFITDVTALRKSQEQLKLLETCVAKLNDIVLISEAEPIDENGPKIVFVNDAFEQRTGFSRDEVLGKTPRILQGPKTQRAELDRIRKALEQWQPVRAELINYKKSGEEFWLEMEIAPVADDKGWYTHWISIERDITKRKLAEIELIRLNRALKLRSAMAELIKKATTEAALLNDACQLAIDVGGYYTAWVGYAHDDKRKSIKPAAVKGSGIDYVMHINASWSESDVRGQGSAGRTIRSGLPVICENYTKDPSFTPWLSNAQAYDLCGMVSLPLKDQSRTFGLIALLLGEVRILAAEEIALLEALADDLAFGIMSLRTKVAQQRAHNAILKVAASVSENSDEGFFEHLNRNMAEALNADMTFIARLLPGKPLRAETLTVIAHNQRVDNFTYLISDTPCQKLLHEDECLITKNVSKIFKNSESLVNAKAEAYMGRRLLNSGGEVTGMIGVVYRNPLKETDILQSTLKIFVARAAAEIERYATDTRLRQQASLLEKAQDAIIVRSLDYKVLYWNKSAERLYGWTAEEAKQITIDEILYNNPDDVYRATQFLLTHGEWNGEVEQQRKDGTVLTIEGRWTLLRDEQGEPESILCINTDVSSRKDAQNKIQELAYYDPLTHLPNRRLLLERLNQTLAAINRNHKIGALLFIDMDNFKTLNDTLGHDVGDLLLVEVANRTKNCVRSSDTVSRFGGDEFVLMVTELSDIKSNAIEQTRIVSEKILATLNQPYLLASHTYYSTSSIGITLIEQEANSAEELLKQADLAMYAAKAAGRNTARFYDDSMKMSVIIRAALESDLRKAISDEEFILHYQPQFNHKNELEGVEALIRWNHTERGMVSPAEFIPVAEETKLILPLGAWVLKAACKQLVAWERTAKTSSLVIAVNVSIHQFRERSFVDNVLSIIRETGANPRKLKLELTESLLVDNVDDVIEKMTALKVKGIQFSLDDFGTGYSSLTYLKKLPLDQIKIDQSFVRDILVDANDASITIAIITLAQNLGLKVIAEGVETEEQRQFLLDHHCFSYQGYLFSRPLSIEKFEEFLAD